MVNPQMTQICALVYKKSVCVYEKSVANLRENTERIHENQRSVRYAQNAQTVRAILYAFYIYFNLFVIRCISGTRFGTFSRGRVPD